MDRGTDPVAMIVAFAGSIVVDPSDEVTTAPPGTARPNPGYTSTPRALSNPERPPTSPSTILFFRASAAGQSTSGSDDRTPNSSDRATV